MSRDHAPSAARDLTLQKIGRNVVNFQKMEAMLKFILTATNFSTPISKVQKCLEIQARSLRNKSMGVLVEGAARALHSEAPTAPQDAKEIWVTHAFTLGEGGSKLPDWRREMRKVVGERNKLIHKMLSSWDPRSLESCRSLCEELDAQRERILPAYEHLESVAKAIRESHLEMAQEVDELVASFLDRRTHGA
jgi:hypothetical protein